MDISYEEFENEYGEIEGAFNYDIENKSIYDLDVRFYKIWVPANKGIVFIGKNGWEADKIELAGNTRNFYIRERDREKKFVIQAGEFKNYAGKVFLYLKNKERCVKVPIEVFPDKYCSNKECKIDEYIEFTVRVIKGIMDRIMDLPFTISPVSWGLEENITVPRPFVKLSFYRNNTEKIDNVLWAISANVHKELVVRENFMDIGKASYIDERVLMGIITDIEYLYEAKKGKGIIKTGDGRRFTPIFVRQPVKYETFDTVPNRFVKYFSSIMQKDLTDLIAMLNVKDNENDEDMEYSSKEKVARLLNSLSNNVRTFNSSVWLSDVKTLNRIPFYSTVLRRKTGYRDLFNLYFEYLKSCALGRILSRFIEIRALPFLYELWVALELTYRVYELCNKYYKNCKIEISVDENRIPEKMKIKLTLTNKVLFEYQHQSSENNENKVYTNIILRPDFVLFDVDGKPYAVFDAKFAWFDDNKSRPSTDDIKTIHAYRDAFRSNTGFVIYPGDEEKFYSVNGVEKNIKNGDLLDKFLKDFFSNFDRLNKITREWEGIGWIIMKPKKGGKDEK